MLKQRNIENVDILMQVQEILDLDKALPSRNRFPDLYRDAQKRSVFSQVRRLRHLKAKIQVQKAPCRVHSTSGDVIVTFLGESSNERYSFKSHEWEIFKAYIVGDTDLEVIDIVE